MVPSNTRVNNVETAACSSLFCNESNPELVSGDVNRSSSSWFDDAEVRFSSRGVKRATGRPIQMERTGHWFGKPGKKGPKRAESSGLRSKQTKPAQTAGWSTDHLVFFFLTAPGTTSFGLGL